MARLDYETIKGIPEAIPFGMDIVDEEARILYANEVLKDIVDEDLVGKRCYEIYKDDRKQCQNCPLKKEEAKREKLTVGGVLGGRTFRITHAPITFNGKEAILEVFEDVTEKVRAEKELEKSLQKIENTLGRTVQAMSSMVDIKDPYTCGHQHRVAVLSTEIAREMGLDDEVVSNIKITGTLHDIGKLYVPSEFLNKPGSLSDLEFEVIKTHPRVGYDILKQINFSQPIAEYVYQHHEKLDGSGYPRGLNRADIWLEARILTVADVVEAISSHRPYRPKLGIDTALEEIKQYSGEKYDREVVESCLDVFDGGFSFDEGD